MSESPRGAWQKPIRLGTEALPRPFRSLQRSQMSLRNSLKPVSQADEQRITCRRNRYSHPEVDRI